MAILLRALRLLTLLVSLYIVGLSAYRIHRTWHSHSKTLWSVTVISGCAALWSIVSQLLPTALLLVALLDLVFFGGLTAIAVLLRLHATRNCGRNRACNLSKAAFSVAIAGAVFFLLLAILSWHRRRIYRKNRAFGPGPDNGYSTSPAAVPRSNRSSRRWSGSEDAGVMAETEAYTRHGHAHGTTRAGGGGYKETGVGGVFDPELQRGEGERGVFDPKLQHGEGVRGHQAS